MIMHHHPFHPHPHHHPHQVMGGKPIWSVADDNDEIMHLKDNNILYCISINSTRGHDKQDDGLLGKIDC
jgi:hypothetical protein